MCFSAAKGTGASVDSGTWEMIERSIVGGDRCNSSAIQGCCCSSDDSLRRTFGSGCSNRPRRSARSDDMSFLRRLTRSEEHTSELQSLMRISYAVFCLTKTKTEIYSTHKP